MKVSGRRRWGRAQLEDRADPYQAGGKISGTAVCSQCGAVYMDGRWQWREPPEDAGTAMCQACRRVHDNYPAGTVVMSGGFVSLHRTELVNLLHHQEAAERAEHPLNRLMRIENHAADRIEVFTTDIHLPRRIGEALERAYDGELSESFDEDGYFVRVSWRRED